MKLRISFKIFRIARGDTVGAVHARTQPRERQWARQRLRFHEAILTVILSRDASEDVGAVFVM